VVEVFSETGDHLLTFVIDSTASLQLRKIARLPAFLRDKVTNLEKAISPGASATLNPYSPIVVTRCPGRAVVGLIELEYADGTRFSYSSGSWRTDPSIIALATSWRIDEPAVKRDAVVNIRVSAGQDGPSAVIAEGPNEFTKWPASDLSHWRFISATVGGKPVEGTLRVLLRLHANENTVKWDEISKYKNDNRPFVVLDIFPSGERKISALCAGFSCTPQ